MPGVPDASELGSIVGNATREAYTSPLPVWIGVGPCEPVYSLGPLSVFCWSLFDSERFLPQLPNKYVPLEHEARVRAKWTESGAFHADPARVLSGEKKPYAIFIPPPNVTDRLHLGHALNNTLQDVLVRAHRMMGFEALWMPGTDHAGIATQTVVEKRVKQDEGLSRADYAKRGEPGRAEFVAKIQAFKDEYEAIITEQLKAMGCSCDWDRQRFTMDEVCAKAVREAFFRLFKDGLIYRGKRLVNWDPVTQTALADDEVEMEEIDGHFYYLRYPLCHGKNGPGMKGVLPVTWDELKRRGYPGAESHPDGDPAWVTVATTRPETYLGDTAVAINPKDPRANALRGLHCELPLVGRVIPIIEDDYVVLPAAMQADPPGGEAAKSDPKAQFATGFLKVTPAHDTNDYEIGRRHNLPVINVMAPDASISDKHGWTEVGDAHLFVGMSREAARKKVVEEFKARSVGGQSLLADRKPYRHSVGHSYRSHAAIEPYLSDQWYVKVTDDRLAGAANRALVQDQRSVGQASSLTQEAVGQASSLPSSAKGTTHALKITQRRLPHWEMGGSTYFLTFRVRTGELSPAERKTVLDACVFWHGKKMRVHHVVVMPDHVHLLMTPLGVSKGEYHPLSEILHSIKSFTANEINRSRGVTGPLWQDESHDRIVRPGNEFEEKSKYLIENPVRAGLASHPGEYPFEARPEWIRPDASGGLDDKEGRLEACPTDLGLRFYPERYAKTYESWHENIRDWCISRQLWWGHRIPVWSRTRRELEQDPKLEGGETIQIRGDWDHSGCIHLHEQLADGSVREMVCPPTIVPSAQPHPGPWKQLKFESVHGSPFVATDMEELAIELEREGFVQDPDVLDTWFSSALWPMSTLGWPEPPKEMKGLLDAFNPSNVLCTAREIITLWVSRMVMFNRYLLGEGQGNGPLPFKDVFIHSVIQDGEGRKMSKSLGNGVNPLDIIQSHGSDAMRFTLCKMTTNTQDVRLPVVFDKEKNCNSSPKFDEGRNFVTKVFNATRFVMMNLEESAGQAPGAAASTPSLADRWILSRLARLTERVNAAIREYDYSGYAEAMYQFLWWDFCDWYVEAIKPTVKTDARQRGVVKGVLDTALRLLHPICPYVTEVLHESLREYAAASVPGLDPGADRGLVCVSDWPKPAPSLIDEAAEKEVEWLRSLTESIRQVRAAQGVEPKRRIVLHTDASTLARIRAGSGLVETLAGLSGVEESKAGTDGATSMFPFEGREHGLSNLKDAVDPAAERKSLGDQVEKLDKAIAVLEGRLANPGYAERAPAKMVQETRDQLAQKTAERDAARARIQTL